MLFAVVNRGRQLIDFDSPDFIRDLVKGFLRGIWMYLGTSCKGSTCDEVQEVATEALQG